jgi:phage nucleotide-binding protein
MSYISLEDLTQKGEPYTALLYCAPGVGKSTAIGLIAEKSKGKTLVLDIDRTITKTLAKREVVKDLSKIELRQIDNIHTWSDWEKALMELGELKKSGKLDFENIAVDNISELERCILSDLGSQGKNKGVPAQADYQYMQFKLVNSLRFMKSLGVNIIWTAWETVELFQNPDGSQYSRLYPKCSAKVVDNICGLCDVVGKILAKQDGTRGIILEATQNIYAKNQIDNRKGCLVEEFINFKKGE